MNNSIIIPPNQMVSDTEKKKKSWQRENLDAFESLLLFEGRQIRTSYHNKVINYNLMRGILDTNDVLHALDPYNLNLNTFPSKMEHKGIGNAKIRYLQSEHTTRTFDFRCSRSSYDTTGIKQVEEQKKAKAIETIKKLIAEEGVSEDEITQRLNKFNAHINSPYFDVAERGANKISKWAYSYYKMSSKFDTTFFDALIAAEQYMLFEYKDNTMSARRIDPTQVFLICDAHSTTEEGLEALTEIRFLSISSIIESFGHLMDKEDYNKLNGLRNTAGTTLLPSHPKFDTIDGYAIPKDSETAKVLPLLQVNDVDFGGNSTMGMWNDSRGHWRVMYSLWRSKRKVKKIKSIDPQYGFELEEYKHGNYKIKEELGESLIKEEWINEWWHGYKIGNDIYCGTEPVPYLSHNVGDIGSQKPPVVYEFYNIGNSRAQSLYDILKPFDYMYDIISYKKQMLINLMLPDVLQYPTSMIPDNMTIHEFINYIMSTATMPLDPTAEIITPKGKQAAGTLNTVVAQRFGASQQAPIQVLEASLDRLERTMDIVSGVMLQRQGAVESKELVGAIERSVSQSSIATEYWFSKNEEFKERCMQRVLDINVQMLRDNPKNMQYLLDDFTRIVLTDEELDAISLTSFDIRIRKSAKDAKILAMLEQQLSQKVANQQAKLSDVVKVIYNDSISEALEYLSQTEAEEEQRAAEQQERQNQQIEEQMKIEQEELQFQRQILMTKLELDKTKIEGELMIKEAEVSLKEAIANGDQESKLIIEEMKADLALRLKEMENTIKKAELKIKEKEVAVKDKAVRHRNYSTVNR
jgi:hypothetical protein